MKNLNVAVVGAGVIGEAIIKVLQLATNPPLNVTIKEKRKDRLAQLSEKYRVQSNPLTDSDIIFIAVKPQDLRATIDEIRDEIPNDALIVSLLAGIKSSALEKSIGRRVRIVRLMPNTPVIVGEGMSVISRGAYAKLDDIEWVSRTLAKAGEVLTIEEELMDAVTAVSGSGPAYFYAFVEAMIKAALRLGLTEQDAKSLVHQTLIGAAKMVQESGKDAATLRGEVTSPNGTTAAALSSFESSGWEEIVYRAMKAARDRSRELSN